MDFARSSGLSERVFEVFLRVGSWYFRSFALCNVGRAAKHALAKEDKQDFTPSKFKAAMKSYPKHSLGSDHWHPNELKYLPDFCISQMCDAYQDAYTKVVQPHQQLLNLDPMLGKPNKGFRTICKTPMWYRAQCRADMYDVRCMAWHKLVRWHFIPQDSNINSLIHTYPRCAFSW